MRCKFLFWNVGKRPVLEQLVRLADDQRADVIALAESVFDPADVLRGFRRAASDFHFQPSEKTKIQVFSRAILGEVVEQFVDGTGNLTIRRFDLKSAPSVLFGVVHLPSKTNWSAEGQAMHSAVVANDVRNVERDVGHGRTIVVGDFNMNPYEAGVAGRQGFNAVMTRHEMRRLDRKVQGRDYPVFYNPMWQFFRDVPGTPGGTFFLRGSSPEAHPWNIFDQVLVRASLVAGLSEVAILAHDGTSRLVNAHGIPKPRFTSDHLPVSFAMNFAGAKV